MSYLARLDSLIACGLILICGGVAEAQEKPLSPSEVCERERKLDEAALNSTIAQAEKLLDGAYAVPGYGELQLKVRRASAGYRQVGKEGWEQAARRDGESESALRTRMDEALRENPVQVQSFLADEYLPRVQAALGGLFRSDSGVRIESAGVTVQADRPRRLGERPTPARASKVLLTATYRLGATGLDSDAPEIRFTYDALSDSVEYQIIPSLEQATATARDAPANRNKILIEYNRCIGGVVPGAGFGEADTGGRKPF